MKFKGVRRSTTGPRRPAAGQAGNRLELGLSEPK